MSNSLIYNDTWVDTCRFVLVPREDKFDPPFRLVDLQSASMIPLQDMSEGELEMCTGFLMSAKTAGEVEIFMRRTGLARHSRSTWSVIPRDLCTLAIKHRMLKEMASWLLPEGVEPPQTLTDLGNHFFTKVRAQAQMGTASFSSLTFWTRDFVNWSPFGYDHRAGKLHDRWIGITETYRYEGVEIHLIMDWLGTLTRTPEVWRFHGDPGDYWIHLTARLQLPYPHDTERESVLHTGRGLLP